jgi:hypothetical protein
MSDMNTYRFEPTGEVRPPTAGEWFRDNNCEDEVTFARTGVDLHYAYPIYRRVPIDAAGELEVQVKIAFTEMWLANFQNWQRSAGYADWFDAAQQRFGSGDRSPELLAEMKALIAKMEAPSHA